MEATAGFEAGSVGSLSGPAPPHAVGEESGQSGHKVGNALLGWFFDNVRLNPVVFGYPIGEPIWTVFLYSISSVLFQ